MRPDGQARRASISRIFERYATPPDGMRRRPNVLVYRTQDTSLLRPMALEIGSRLGHYNVTALIGEGGMGQVYQATDTKLNRQVALKILPEAFATDLDRLARFQREAQGPCQSQPSEHRGHPWP